MVGCERGIRDKGYKDRRTVLTLMSGAGVNPFTTVTLPNEVSGEDLGKRQGGLTVAQIHRELPWRSKPPGLLEAQSPQGEWTMRRRTTLVQRTRAS